MKDEDNRQYLNSTDGTKVMPDFSVVDWWCKIPQSALDAAALETNQQARSPDDTFELSFTCTIVCRIRAERALPKLWEIDPNIAKYGCGEDWHYERHTSGERCPTCRQSIYSPIDEQCKWELYQNFNKDRFPRPHLRLVHSS